MSQLLAQRGVKPDVMLSSPAVRARTTAETFAAALGYAVGDVALDGRLYAASAATVLAVVGSLGDQVKTAMVFGHNPGLTALAHRLAPGTGEMPTCAVLELTFDTLSWAVIGSTPPTRVKLDCPKRL
jgi:phosphohistidine phosphatase